jgi:hypothetical protein
MISLFDEIIVVFTFTFIKSRKIFFICKRQCFSISSRLESYCSDVCHGVWFLTYLISFNRYTSLFSQSKEIKIRPTVVLNCYSDLGLNTATPSPSKRTEMIAPTRGISLGKSNFYYPFGNTRVRNVLKDFRKYGIDEKDGSKATKVSYFKFHILSWIIRIFSFFVTIACTFNHIFLH